MAQMNAEKASIHCPLLSSSISACTACLASWSPEGNAVCVCVRSASCHRRVHLHASNLMGAISHGIPHTSSLSGQKSVCGALQAAMQARSPDSTPVIILSCQVVHCQRAREPNSNHQGLKHMPA